MSIPTGSGCDSSTAAAEGDAVNEVSPSVKLEDLREMVALLALSAPQQAEWLARGRVPVDEMYLQLDDAVPAWFGRLAEAELLTPELGSAAERLMAQLASMNDRSLWSDAEALARTEWAEVRRLAHVLVAAIDAAPAQTGMANFSRRLFDDALKDLDSVADASVRVPGNPFRTAGHSYSFCQFPEFMGGDFGSVIARLAESHSDLDVTCVVIEPTVGEYYDQYGTWPVFRVAADLVEDRYWDLLNWEPGGDPTGAIVHSSNTAVVFGGSNEWAVWGQRSWGIAVIAASDVDESGRGTDIPFFHLEEGLDIAREEFFTRAMFPAEANAFLRSFGTRSEPGPGEA